VVGGGAQLGDLALGGRGQLVGLAPGAGADAVGLALGGAAQVIGLPLGDGPQLGRLVLGGGPQLGGLDLGRRVQLVGGRPGFLHYLGGLFLGEPQKLLNTRTQSGVGGPFLLLKLAVRVGELLLEGLGLIPVLAKVGVDPLQVLIDLMRVVTTHDPGKVALRSFLEEVAELCIDVGLHGRLILCRPGEFAQPGNRLMSPVAGPGSTDRRPWPGRHAIPLARCWQRTPPLPRWRPVRGCSC